MTICELLLCIAGGSVGGLIVVGILYLVGYYKW